MFEEKEEEDEHERILDELKSFKHRLKSALRGERGNDDDVETSNRTSDGAAAAAAASGDDNDDERSFDFSSSAEDDADTIDATAARNFQRVRISVLEKKSDVTTFRVFGVREQIEHTSEGDVRTYTLAPDDDDFASDIQGRDLRGFELVKIKYGLLISKLNSVCKKLMLSGLYETQMSVQADVQTCFEIVNCAYATVENRFRLMKTLELDAHGDLGALTRNGADKAIMVTMENSFRMMKANRPKPIKNVTAYCIRQAHEYGLGKREGKVVVQRSAYCIRPCRTSSGSLKCAKCDLSLEEHGSKNSCTFDLKAKIDRKTVFPMRVSTQIAEDDITKRAKKYLVEIDDFFKDIGSSNMASWINHMMGHKARIQNFGVFDDYNDHTSVRKEVAKMLTEDVGNPRFPEIMSTNGLTAYLNGDFDTRVFPPRFTTYRYTNENGRDHDRRTAENFIPVYYDSRMIREQRRGDPLPSRTDRHEFARYSKFEDVLRCLFCGAEPHNHLKSSCRSKQRAKYDRERRRCERRRSIESAASRAAHRPFVPQEPRFELACANCGHFRDDCACACTRQCPHYLVREGFADPWDYEDKDCSRCTCGHDGFFPYKINGHGGIRTPHLDRIYRDQGYDGEDDLNSIKIILGRLLYGLVEHDNAHAFTAAIGRGGTGKSLTIEQIIMRIRGEHNCGNLQSSSKEFALSTACDENLNLKPLIVIPDMNDGNKFPIKLGTFKGMTGGGTTTLNRKNKPQETRVCKSQIVLATNVLKINDSTGALTRRALVITHNIPIQRRDGTLQDKLMSNMAAIHTTLVYAYRQACDDCPKIADFYETINPRTRKPLMSKKMQEAKRQSQGMTSDIRAFLRAIQTGDYGSKYSGLCLRYIEQGYVGLKVLRKEFQSWLRESGRKIDVSQFSRENLGEPFKDFGLELRENIKFVSGVCGLDEEHPLGSTSSDEVGDIVLGIAHVPTSSRALRTYNEGDDDGTKQHRWETVQDQLEEEAEKDGEERDDDDMDVTLTDAEKQRALYLKLQADIAALRSGIAKLSSNDQKIEMLRALAGDFVNAHSPSPDGGVVV